MNGRKVRKLRKECGLTQEEFAQKLGVSFATINRIENHHHSPSPLLLRQLELLAEEHRRATRVSGQ